MFYLYIEIHFNQVSCLINLRFFYFFLCSIPIDWLLSRNRRKSPGAICSAFSSTARHRVVRLSDIGAPNAQSMTPIATRCIRPCGLAMRKWSDDILFTVGGLMKVWYLISYCAAPPPPTKHSCARWASRTCSTPPRDRASARSTRATRSTAICPRCATWAFRWPTHRARTFRGTFILRPSSLRTASTVAVSWWTN